MNRIKVTDNFYLDEFLNPVAYKRFGARATRYVYHMFAPVQLFRDLVKVPVTICNWFTGGVYKESGLRYLFTRTGASYSMHKFGGADDLKAGTANDKMTSFEMADVIKNNWDRFRQLGIRRIEDPESTQSKHGKKGRDWLHMDNGQQYYMNAAGLFVPKTDIIIVKP